MSGVTGNIKIQSRKDFKTIVKHYKKIISKFPGFTSLDTSGSYNSNKAKTTFGDIDLIVNIDGSMYDNDKMAVKKALAKYLTSQSDKEIVPFISDKYAGKRFYNSGEIITVSYKAPEIGIEACQIDNIIALDEVEAKFKKDFLDMPAEKQGLVLGLTKVATLETPLKRLFKKVGINAPTEIDKNQEYEFNLSSKEIQLRLVTYDAELLAKGKYKQTSRTIEWTSRDFTKLESILWQFKLDVSFNDLVKQSKAKLKNARSLRRISGVFKSMISIKSGEVGTEKGANKQKALDKVQRIFGESVSFRTYLNEKEGTGYFVGRFQPPTKAHHNIILQIAKENKKGIIFLVKGKKSSQDKNVNPFDENTQIEMLKTFLPQNVSIEVIPSGFFPDYVKDENATVYCGTDRVSAYTRMSKGTNIKIKEIKRDDSDTSATKLRVALRDNDFNEFKKHAPKEMYSMFDELVTKV